MSDKTDAVDVVAAPVLVDKQTCAQMLGRISPCKIDELVRDGRLAAKRIDRRVVFELDEVKRFAADLPGWEPTS